MNPCFSTAIAATACFSAVAGVAALAADAPSAGEKGGYHLFKPTPRELMREMSTDRPDKTESAYTVDAGHFQIEMDVFNYAYDRYNTERADVRTESLAIAPMNLKLGLGNRVDLQLVLQTYNSVRIDDRRGGEVEKHRGFGDVIGRMKFNLWGNDGGRTALAVMPYVKLPTHQDGLGTRAVEGGLILPLAAELGYGFGLGIMTQFDCLRDETGGGHHAEFVNTLTLSHDIAGKLGGYVEFFSAVSAEKDAPWMGTLDLGFTYGLTADIQLDAGINIGVTRSAEDWNPFLGLSWRF